MLAKTLGFFSKGQNHTYDFFNCYVSAKLTFAWIKKEDDNKNVLLLSHQRQEAKLEVVS